MPSLHAVGCVAVMVAVALFHAPTIPQDEVPMRISLKLTCWAGATLRNVNTTLSGRPHTAAGVDHGRARVLSVNTT
jgi:hypothetical protein